MLPTTESIQHIRLDQITRGNNDREQFPADELRELADSIASAGLAQPITVRPVATVCGMGHEQRPPWHVCFTCGDRTDFPECNRYEIIAGERRYRACTLLGWDTIPCIVRDMSDEQASTVMLLENIQRADLSPIEEARAYDKRMQAFGWTRDQVASAAHVKPARVRDMVALLNLREDIQSLVGGANGLPLPYAIALAELPRNAQHLGLRYFNSAARPTLPQFQARIAAHKSLAAVQQAQFCPDEFWEKQQAQHEAQHCGRLKTDLGRVPDDESLPLWSIIGTVSTSEAVEQILIQCLQSSDPYISGVAAGMIGHLYRVLILSAGLPVCDPSPLMQYLDGLQARAA